MNLLEHYIVEIHSVVEAKSIPGAIIVDMTINCYGNKNRLTKGFMSTSEFEDVKRRGFYMA